MALTQKEKDRIFEEEKARLEARKEYYKESYGGSCGSGWHGSSCRCCGHGWGFFKIIFAVIILYAIFHCWNRSNCGVGTCLWGTSSTTTTTSAPVVPPAKPAVSPAKPVVRPVKPAVPPAQPAAPPVTK